jgi:Zn-dependent protease
VNGADVRVFLETLPILIVSMTLHEMAHGWVAFKLGDATAKLLGRLSPNPLRHVDPLGTAVFALTYFGSGGSFVFGWAKPVPVMPHYFRDPRRGMALVGIAGPITNFVLALALAAYYVHVGASGELQRVLELSLVMNVALGIFNLIPIPPLDGSRVVGVLMDDDTYRRWIALDQYGIVIILAVFTVFRVQSQSALISTRNDVLEWMFRAVGA